MRTQLLAAVLGLGVSAVVLAQTADQVTPNDPILGIWELNVAKSSFNLSPPVKSETRTFTLVGQEIKVTSSSVTLDGKTEKAAWTLVHDGKDRPITGSAVADSLSVTRTDPYHATAVNKKGGKVVRSITRVISPDGKTMTFTSKGTNGKGEAVTDVLVFDKK